MILRALLLLLSAMVLTSTACPIPSRKPPSAHDAPTAADVVVINLHGEITETGEEGRLLRPSATSLRKLLRTLRQARTNKKVHKVVLRIGQLQVGWAQLTELRQAIQRIRQAGKPVIAHLDEGANAEYFLASAASEITLAEGGSLWLVGVAARVLFLKGLLEKVGIEAEFLQQGRYKGAAESLTRKSMSPELREALTAILDNTYSSLVKAVAEARKLSPDKVRQIIDEAPHPAAQLKALGLIDRIGTHTAQTRRLAGKGSINWSFGKKKKETGTLRSLMELFKPSIRTRPPKRPHLALVYAEGPIIYGPRLRGLGVAPHVASHDLVTALDKLGENKRVQAVVIRIDSPGGSALASELIFQAVKRLAAIKPVVVSMGDVAASGGYYIAAPASRILAQPMTLTGSIGVVGGKFSLAGLFQKIGVGIETINRGKRADLFNFGRSWTPEERTVIKAYMARTYKQFVNRVASGRKLTPAAVQRVAEGRIWSGRAALGHKLVDRLGGLLDAIAEAKKLGKLPDSAKTAVYPRPKTWIEKLQEGLGTADTRSQLLHYLTRGTELGPVLPRLIGTLQALPRWQRDRVLTWMPMLFMVR